jgi:hypothetical protein
MSAAAGRWLLIGAGVAVVATIVAAIATMGTPGQQRLVREDGRRQRDLARLRTEVNGWATQNGALPADLAALVRPGVRVQTSDPFTSQSYEYQVLGDRDYRLCAVFNTDSAGEERNDDESLQWRHPRGRHCFDLKLPKPGKVEP